MRLSPGAVLPGSVALPAYDRNAHRIGQVHIGLGAFHRAHQGAYTDAALSAGDRDFLIAGVSMRQPTAANELNPQSGLYTLTERNGEARRTRLIGAVREVLVATEQPDAVVAALADKAVTVVTLTITEKGYARLADGAPPPFCALVLQALEIRRRNGVGGLTLLSCDNLPDNGAVLGALVRESAAARNQDLARWIEAECAFPSSMVDRIVPAVTEADRDAVEEALGLRDEGAVLTEPFSQWVIEDRFAARRPRWEAMGAQIVPDVRPFEKAKLRMLNGAHSALAYLGLERGWTYVHEAVADPVLAPVIARLMRIEAARSFTPAPGQNLEAYADALIARFANTALNHRLSQIAMDGSQKIPQRWLETLAVHQARGEPSPALITALAAWVRHVRADARTVDDPRAAELAELWRTWGEDGVASALFGPSGLFAHIWSADETSLAALTKAVKDR